MLSKIWNILHGFEIRMDSKKARKIQINIKCTKMDNVFHLMGVILTEMCYYLWLYGRWKSIRNLLGEKQVIVEMWFFCYSVDEKSTYSRCVDGNSFNLQGTCMFIRKSRVFRKNANETSKYFDLHCYYLKQPKLLTRLSLIKGRSELF